MVVDNPPFSILAQILDHYHKTNIKIFLFAPTLTMFSKASENYTCLPTGGDITYENGAVVSTSFVTNLEDTDIKVRTYPDLYQAIKKANEENLRAVKKHLPKYSYPDNVLTAAMAYRYSQYGVEYTLRSSDCVKIEALDSQRAKGKAIFGKGFLLSERAAAERAAAERWQLSERELTITSADVSGADISASSASSPLYGSSEVDGGSVSSVGDNGLTITTSNSDNTVTTSSAVTTALPLRGIDDMADILTVSAATGSVTSKFGAVDLSTLTWEGMGTAGETKQLYKAAIPDMLQPAVASQRNTYILCDTYSVSAVTNYTLMDARTCLRVSIRICFRRQRRGIVTRSRQLSRSARRTPRTEIRTARPRKKRHKICTFF